jgi:signal-transduction protein with cAMP-binding, CBS, and nucleotidyltransferase domain
MPADASDLRGVRDYPEEVAPPMKVEDGMSELVLTIGPAHTLRQAAQMMAARHVGAAVVIDAEREGVGIITERDLLNSIAADEDPDTEVAGQHCTQDLVFAARHWTLQDAAAAMVRGGFRHLVVVEGAHVVGLLSMRDIVRCWSSSAVPAQASAQETSTAART